MWQERFWSGVALYWKKKKIWKNGYQQKKDFTINKSTHAPSFCKTKSVLLSIINIFESSYYAIFRYFLK